MKDLKDAKYPLKALLLRNNINSKVKDNWSLQHLRWLAELVLPHPCQQIVLQDLAEGQGKTSLPAGHPYAITEFKWQYIFPSTI